MFGDFEANCQIEKAIECKLLGKIGRVKTGWIDQELGAINVVAVDSANRSDAVLDKCLQPGTRATTDVHHARRVKQFHNEWNNGAG
jgi:hypothetical protein